MKQGLKRLECWVQDHLYRPGFRRDHPIWIPSASYLHKSRWNLIKSGVYYLISLFSSQLKESPPTAFPQGSAHSHPLHEIPLLCPSHLFIKHWGRRHLLYAMYSGKTADTEMNQNSFCPGGSRCVLWETDVKQDNRMC